MATYNYQPNSSRGYREPWLQYLLQFGYHVHTIATLNRNSEAQIDAIHEQTARMVGSIERMSSDISNSIEMAGDQISGAIESMNATMDWRLSQLIDCARITNLLTMNIATLLRIPDFQKERQYYIEKGFQHYSNASYNQELFIDALKSFKEAESREPTDYIVLHRIGLILLYDSQQLDVEAAEQYFRRAAKYAEVESSQGAVQLANVLTGSLDQKLTTLITPQQQIRQLAADAFTQAGIACYVQGKFDEAVEMSRRATEQNPELVAALFNTAKFLAAGNRAKEAVPILQLAIEKDALTSIAIVNDIDLITKTPVRNLLEELRNQIIEKADNLYHVCKKNMIRESVFQKEVLSVGKLIARNTFLDGHEAFSKLNKPMSFCYTNYDKESNTVNLCRVSDGKILQIFIDEDNKFNPDGFIFVSLAKVIQIESENESKRVHLQKLIERKKENGKFKKN